MATRDCPLCGKPRPAVGDPLGVQAATPGRLARLIRGLRGAERLARPAPGKWSIHEIVCHLADAELANAWRYRKVLAGEALAPTAWDQDVWAARHRYRRQDLRLVLEQFRSLRARNLALLRVVGRRAWGRAVALPGGSLNARQMLEHLAHHDLNHLAQVADLRAAALEGRSGRRRTGRGGSE